MNAGKKGYLACKKQKFFFCRKAAKVSTINAPNGPQSRSGNAHLRGAANPGFNAKSAKERSLVHQVALFTIVHIPASITPFKTKLSKNMFS